MARWRRTLAVTGAVVVMLGAAACGDEPATPAEDTAPPQLSISAEILQQRRDQVEQRIQIAVRNDGPSEVVVRQLAVDLPGYADGDPIPKDSRIPPGRVVNLPWSYGDVTCPVDGVRSAPALVALDVQPADGTAARLVSLTATDPRGLLVAIAERTCTLEQLAEEVELRFGDAWTLERTPEGPILRGILRARLLAGGPRTIVEVRGAILYGLRPDESAPAPPAPLATVTPERPSADIPVVAYAARCDGHTIGEIKKPYEFLVWVGSPGDEPIATTPAVGEPTKKALRQVCAF